MGEAEDGREAVELASAIEPDVVLMDVDLPTLNGIDATRIIKARLPRVQVIGLSVHQEKEVIESMRAAGAADVFPKGGRPDRLFQRIRELAPKTSLAHG